MCDIRFGAGELFAAVLAEYGEGMPRLLRLQDVRATAAGEQPVGYQLAGRGVLNIGVLSVISLLAFIPALLFFVLVTGPFGGPINLQQMGEIHVDLVGLLLFVMTVVVILPIVHELMHGAVAALLGARPVYGIGPGIAFCHFREFVTKRAYAAILVAPLAVISIVGVALMPITPLILRGPLLGLLVTNAAGAVGDIAMLWQLRRLPADVLIADTNAGYEYYVPTAE